MKNLAILAVAALAGFAAPAAAQAPGAGGGARVGIMFGGTSTVGFVFELFENENAVELTLGTWSFRDLAVSGVAKRYFGAGAAQPFVGAGLWTVLSFPPNERTGVALAVRAPIGVDWNPSDDHALGAALAVNRGLWVRRSDPDDDLPLNERLVPLPEFYYRFTR